jgi:hypothetical protein
MKKMGFGELVQLAKTQNGVAETNRLLKQQVKLLAEIKVLLQRST